MSSGEESQRAKMLSPRLDKTTPDTEAADVCVMTDIECVSLYEVATAIAAVLRGKNLKVKIADWGKTHILEKDLIFVGPLYVEIVNYLARFLPGKNIILYAAVEGVPILDPSTKKIAKALTVITPSNYSKTNIEKAGVEVETVIRHGIPLQRKPDTDYSNYIRENIFSPKTQQVTLYVAKNEYRKAIDKFLVACKIWERLVPTSFSILHSGGAPEKIGYEVPKIMQTLSLKRTWFTNQFGLLNHNRVDAFYDLMNFYTCPSMTEGFNLPIIEAFNYGKPVIAIDIPPHRELIQHEKTGLLVPYTKAETLRWLGKVDLEIYQYDVDALIHAMVKMNDPDMQAKMAKEAYAEREKYDMIPLYSKFVDYVS